MTDKQIIIDGIDVGGCIYYEDGKCLNGEMVQCNCKKVAVCYYKEYKRSEAQCEAMFVSHTDLEKKYKAKEQECEELASENYELNELFDRLKAENDELKAENKILKEKFEIAIKNNMDKTLLRLEKGDVQEELQEIREQFGIETLYCHDDNTRVHRCLDVLKLKDTLTEIKEMLKEICMEECLFDWNKTSKKHCGDCDCRYGQILQKISEVEDETN